MFKNKQQLRCQMEPGMIAFHSDYAWLIFFGKTPQYGERLYSPFRNDRRPGCRWSYYKDQWYFVDNNGYTWKGQDKIQWSIYDFVSWLYPNLSFDEVYQLICRKLTETINITPVRRPNIRQVQQSNIIIKFEYEEWDENNYFTNNFDIDPAYLNKQPYYRVVTYWANSRNNNSVRKNPFYNPSKILTIAYHFESDNVKLYWPEQPKNKMKWFSNTNSNDIFGEHRLHTYQKGSNLFITKSGKDEMVLNYHLGINTLAVQNEAITDNAKLLKISKDFNTYILYDNDDTGKKNGGLLAKNLGGIQLEINENFKDPSEAYNRTRNFKWFEYERT